MLKLCVRCSNCCDMSNIFMMARKSIYFWINEYICAVCIGVMYNIIVYNREHCIFKKNRWMIKIKLHFIMIMMRKCRRVKCGVIFVLALMLLCEVCMSMCMRVAVRHIYSHWYCRHHQHHHIIINHHYHQHRIFVLSRRSVLQSSVIEHYWFQTWSLEQQHEFERSLHKSTFSNIRSVDRRPHRYCFRTVIQRFISNSMSCERERCFQGLRARQHRPSVACVVVKITQKGPSGSLGPPLLAWRHEVCPTPWLSKFSHFKLSEIGNLMDR